MHQQRPATLVVIAMVIILPGVARAGRRRESPITEADMAVSFAAAPSPLRLAIERALVEETGGSDPLTPEHAPALLLPEPVLSLPPEPGPSEVVEDDDRTDDSSDPFAHSPAARRAFIGPCKGACRWISGTLALAGVGALASLDEESNASIGNWTRQVPWLAGLTMTLVGKDYKGLEQMSLAAGSALFATWGLKRVAGKERPNASSDTSYTSGHATAGFVGASFVYRRYGPRWGVPAWVLAAYTGATRVYAERHYVDDVLSSLSVSLVSNWLFTTPISERVAINPSLAENGFGFTMSVATTREPGGESLEESTGRQPRFRYQWELGPATVTENSVTAPNEGGGPLDFRFDELNNPLYTTRIDFDWRPSSVRRQDALFSFAPFEIREFGSFDQDTEFAGETFPAGQDLRSRSVAYDLTGVYRWRLIPEGRFDLRAGGGVAVLYTLAGLAPVERHDADGHLDFTEADTLDVLPILHLHLGYAFGKRQRWTIMAEGSGMDLSGNRFLDATAQFGFRISPRWDVNLGVRRTERSTDAGSLANSINWDQYVMAIGYRF